MIEIERLTKYYGDIKALDNVSTRIFEERVSILGENGAGKSTLLKILYGITPKSSGKIFVEGREYDPRSPKDAIKFGFRYIPQFPYVVESFKVEEFLKMARIKPEIFRDYCEKFDVNVDINNRMKDLDVSQRRMLYLIVSIINRGKYYLLDEITSGLPEMLRKKILEIIGEIEGTKILVSHYIDEAIEFSYKIIVLRKGKVVGEFYREEFNRKEILEAMFGREISNVSYKRYKEGEVLLEIDGVEVRRGKIIGIFGIAGNGQRELFLKLVLNGKVSHACNILRYSIIPNMNLLENLLLVKVRNGVPGVFRKDFLKNLEDEVKSIIEKYRVECDGIYQEISKLSGGNIMKFIVGRALESTEDVVVLYNPTSGLDEYSKRIIWERIQEMKKKKGILIISEDFDDSQICDEIYVIKSGKIEYFSNRENLDLRKLGEAMVKESNKL